MKQFWSLCLSLALACPVSAGSWTAIRAASPSSPLSADVERQALADHALMMVQAIADKSAGVATRRTLGAALGTVAVIGGAYLFQHPQALAFVVKHSTSLLLTVVIGMSWFRRDKAPSTPEISAEEGALLAHIQQRRDPRLRAIKDAIDAIVKRGITLESMASDFPTIAALAVYGASGTDGGATLYNEGDRLGCAVAYGYASRVIQDAVVRLKPGPPINQWAIRLLLTNNDPFVPSTRTNPHPQQSKEWRLRPIFDAIIATAARTSNTASSGAGARAQQPPRSASTDASHDAIQRFFSVQYERIAALIARREGGRFDKFREWHSHYADAIAKLSSSLTGGYLSTADIELLNNFFGQIHGFTGEKAMAYKAEDRLGGVPNYAYVPGAEASGAHALQLLLSEDEPLVILTGGIYYELTAKDGHIAIQRFTPASDTQGAASRTGDNFRVTGAFTVQLASDFAQSRRLELTAESPEGLVARWVLPARPPLRDLPDDLADWKIKLISLHSRFVAVLLRDSHNAQIRSILNILKEGLAYFDGLEREPDERRYQAGLENIGTIIDETLRRLDAVRYAAPATPTTRQDYYETLGVARDASERAIQIAYRALARENHPDLNPGDRGKEEKFKKIAEAYAVLSNAEKRAAYDGQTGALTMRWVYAVGAFFGRTPRQTEKYIAPVLEAPILFVVAVLGLIWPWLERTFIAAHPGKDPARVRRGLNRVRLSLIPVAAVAVVLTQAGILPVPQADHWLRAALEASALTVPGHAWWNWRNEDAALTLGSRPTNFRSLDTVRSTINTFAEQFAPFRALEDKIEEVGGAPWYGYTWGTLTDYGPHVLWAMAQYAFARDRRLQDLRVLQVGAGPGYFKQLLDYLHIPTDAWDINTHLIRLANRFGKVAIQEQDLFQAAPAKQPYDLVVAYLFLNVAKHPDLLSDIQRRSYPDDVQAAVESIRRIATLVKPGGRLVHRSKEGITLAQDFSGVQWRAIHEAGWSLIPQRDPRMLVLERLPDGAPVDDAHHASHTVRNAA